LGLVTSSPTKKEIFNGLNSDDGRNLAWGTNAVERENAQLRRAVAELRLEKPILKDIAQGNF